MRRAGWPGADAEPARERAGDLPRLIESACRQPLRRQRHGDEYVGKRVGRGAKAIGQPGGDPFRQGQRGPEFQAEHQGVERARVVPERPRRIERIVVDTGEAGMASGHRSAGIVLTGAARTARRWLKRDLRTRRTDHFRLHGTAQRAG